MMLNKAKSLVCVSCPLNAFCGMRGASPCPKNGLRCQLVGVFGGEEGSPAISEGKGQETHAYKKAIAEGLDPKVTFMSFVLVPKVLEDADNVVSSQLTSILHPKLDSSVLGANTIHGGNDE